MIPTVIVVGIVLGRWWWAALLVSAIGWPLLLAATGVATGGILLAAAAIALPNALAGVLLYQAGAWIVRHLRRRVS
ncbi:MAG TPA: hypothetical protein VK891_04065 [Euzebyales bacterium]|nr:hypothetical protein [Euzebyales bacterium]